MARLILKALTCHTTHVPVGSDVLRLRLWPDNRKATLLDVDIGAMDGGQERELDGEVKPVEFDAGAHLELWGPSERFWATEVGADREWELTSEIRYENAHYTLRYVVVLTRNDGQLVAPATCKDGACKTRPTVCNVSDPVQPCPLANLTVEVRSHQDVSIVGAKVTLTALNGAPHIVAAGMTDADGIVNFGTLDSGQYAATATKPRHGPEVSRPFTLGLAESRVERLTLDPAHLYFALYYTKPKDKAFERAAQTWKRKLLARPTYNVQLDHVLMMGFLKINDFRNAWHQIQTQSVGFNRKILEGHVFSHGTPDGIEFPDGTFNTADIRALEVLNWERPGGELVLHGCRAAVGGGRSPAATFAQRQRVKTTGFQGYGSFSEDEDDYVRTNPRSRDMHLNDYDCVTQCVGDRRPPQVFHPPAEGTP